MRRAVALLAIVALCLAATGCGGGDEPRVTPLDDALGYFAKDAPFVAAVETDPDGPQIKQALELLNRFPLGAGRVRDMARARLETLTRFRSVRYERDIKPLLGDQLVIGLTKPAAGDGLSVPLVLALHVRRPTKAKQVLLRQSGVLARGKAHGVRVYENRLDRRYAAVDGEVLLIATNRDVLEQAIGMKRTDNRMREAGFTADVKGLADGALVRVSADPRSMLGADARLRRGLDVKWIASMRRLGATLKAVKDGVALDLRITTEAGDLRDGDLPLAPEPGPIPLLGDKGDVQAGVREPGRLARLAYDFWRAVAPRQAARFRAAAAGRVDMSRVLRHMDDVGVVAVDPRTRRFAARLNVIEPADVRDGMAGIVAALPDVAAALGAPGVGIATPDEGESFYALARPGGWTVVFGVVGKAVVAASEAARAAGLASEPTRLAPGKPAAAVLSVNAREVAAGIIGDLVGGPASLFAPLAVEKLRDFTLRATITREALRAQGKLTIVR